MSDRQCPICKRDTCQMWLTHMGALHPSEEERAAYKAACVNACPPGDCAGCGLFLRCCLCRCPACGDYLGADRRHHTEFLCATFSHEREAELLELRRKADEYKVELAALRERVRHQRIELAALRQDQSASWEVPQIKVQWPAPKAQVDVTATDAPGYLLVGRKVIAEWRSRHYTVQKVDDAGGSYTAYGSEYRWRLVGANETDWHETWALGWMLNDVAAACNALRSRPWVAVPVDEPQAPEPPK